MRGGENQRGKQIKKSLLSTLKIQMGSRGGPSIGHGCPNVHPIILANEIEVSR
jgi:hypothetical protein